MRYCLIIDDNKQEEEISLLEGKSKERQFPITCHFFDPTNKACQRPEKLPDGSTKYLLDLELVYEELKRIYTGQNIDLVALDYKISDDYVSGLDLLKFLKEKKWRGKIPYIIYSSDANELKELQQKEIKTIVDNKEDLNKFLEEYHNTYPDKIFNRGKKDSEPYFERIFEYLKKNKSPLNYKLYQKLNEHPERVFKNIIFPRFKDQKLGHLAKLVIENNSEESDLFEDEFLERSVAHFINLVE